MASVPPKQPLRYPASVVLATATAGFSSSPMILIMHDARIDDQGSSSFQPSHSATPTTSNGSNTSMSMGSGGIGQRIIPSTGPMVAGILAGMIVIVTIVVICFIKNRRKPSHRPYHSRISSQSGSHPHQRFNHRFLQDETSSVLSPQHKYLQRHSSSSSDTMELDVQNSAVAEDGRRSAKHSDNRGRDLGSTSANLSMDKMGANSSRQTANGKKLSTLTSSDLGTALVNQVERRSPRPTMEIVLPPLQPPSLSSENSLVYSYQHPNKGHNSTSSIDVGRLPDDPIQQRAALLLASRNPSDKYVRKELLLSSQKIQVMRPQDMSPIYRGEPPPYEGQ